MWSDLVMSLSPSWRVLAPDLRGFGASPLPGETFSDADDLIALLDELRIEQAAVVGASLGGRVALELAVSDPARVARLVLLCPAYRGLPPGPDLRALNDAQEQLLVRGD